MNLSHLRATVAVTGVVMLALATPLLAQQKAGPAGQPAPAVQQVVGAPSPAAPVPARWLASGATKWQAEFRR